MTSHNEKMSDIDGYAQSQRDFYTIKPHLYAQQPVKGTGGAQQFHLNAQDANTSGGPANGNGLNGTNGYTNPAMGINGQNGKPTKAEVMFNMTPHEIRLTQNLWSELMTEPEALEKSAAYGSPTALFCEQFYTNLMASHAEISSIFPSIKKQSVAVAGVFGLAIKSLNNIESLDEFLWSVGKRHNRMIGVEPVHYRWLGEAMVQTFADRFGERFTLEVETAWIKIYSYLANKLLVADEEPNVLMFAPQKNRYQANSISMLSTSPSAGGQSLGNPGISPTHSYTGAYATPQDNRKPSIASSTNSQSINTAMSSSTAPSSMVHPTGNAVPGGPATANSARRNVSAAPSVVPVSMPAPQSAADYSSTTTKNLRMKAGRKHGRKGKDDDKCVVA